MAGLDAAIAAQLQSLKANMGNPMMGAPPRPMMGNPMMGNPMMGAPPQAVAPAPGPGPNNAVLLSVAVNNLPFRYSLHEADLHEMCVRWGKLQAVHIYRDGQREVGVVIFADPIDAADCQKQLNGHVCSFDSPGGSAQGSLAAVIGVPEQLAPPLPRQQQAMQGPPGGPMGGPPPMGALMPGQAPPGGAFSPQGQMMGMGGMPMQGSMPKSAPEHMKGNGKGAMPGWSCKVIVQAERLHPDFPTVLKICGEANMNLDHVRSQGACTVELRGQRSNTVDVRTGQELPEPMFLRLESETQEAGVAVLEMVKDLLGSVYDEHQQWCMQNKLQWHENLQPQVVENPHLSEGF